MSTTTFLTPTDATFDQEVLEREGTVLVEFWAPWCGPCLATKPMVELVAAERAGTGLQVAFVDVDDSPELSQRFDIRSIPALKLFRDGQIVSELRGAQSKAQIDAWLPAALVGAGAARGQGDRAAHEPVEEGA